MGPDMVKAPQWELNQCLLHFRCAEKHSDICPRISSVLSIVAKWALLQKCWKVLGGGLHSWNAPACCWPWSFMVCASLPHWAFLFFFPFRYSIEQMYDVVADIASYRLFVPWCTDSHVLSCRNEFSQAELEVGFPPVVERYISEISLVPQRQIRVRSSKVGACVHPYTGM